MRASSRPRPIRTVREVGFEDRFHNKPEGPLHHAVSNRRNRNHADFAALLGNLSPTIRPWVVPVRAQFLGEFREKLSSALRLNRLERLVVGPRGSAIALGLQVRRFERIEFHDVDVQSPKAMRRGGLRPLAYLRSKLLQTYGGLCHPALASLLYSDCLRQGPFARRALPRFFAHTNPSVRLSPSPHFALRLARLPCFRGFSPRGEEPFPVFSHDLVRVLPSFTPPGGASADLCSVIDATRICHEMNSPHRGQIHGRARWLIW